MEKQPRTPDEQTREPRPDETLMFNPQTRSYDVRQKTPTELQQDLERAESQDRTPAGPTPAREGR
jgi:hypothetical protein